MKSAEREKTVAVRCTGLLAMAVVLVLPLASWGQDEKSERSGVVPDPGFARQVRVLRATRDAGDYYLYQRHRVALQRSNDMAVRFAPAVTAEGAERIVREIDPTARIESPQRRGTRGVSIVHFPDVLADGAKPDDEAAAAKRLMERTRALNARSDVSWALPVFVNPRTGNRLALSDEIIVRLSSKATVEDVAARHDLAVVEPLWGTSDEYVLRVLDPRKTDPLAVANAVNEGGLVLWAQPNFVQEYRKSATPNDPSFPSQWHLNNTGQGGGTADADPDLPEAWDLNSGSPDIVIAVIDDGVEMTHEDLSASIYSNSLEIAGNGVDDDGNGYVDDVNGWDFSNGDNDPSPMSADDNHGTAVAGVAAGRGNNAVGISGACQSCRILPVKVFSPSFVGDSEAANAIRYAASLADVLNNSWGGGSPSSAIQSAIQWATTSGRRGKGSVVLFASGNYASGYYTFTLTGVPAGTHRFRWSYSKDGADTDPTGADTAWLGWVELPGGVRANFQSGMPSGFSSGGSAVWSVVSDRAHADEGWCFTHAAKAGTITHNQTTYLDAVRTVSAGALRYTAWVESEGDGAYIYDYLRLEVDLNNDGADWFGPFFYQGGIPYVSTGVAYPAAYAEAVAVGASSDFDCRSCYSEYGPELDLVAPSNGGSSAITTTDRMGASGYDAASNYTSTFGGTSSATPLTSGIVGLMLSLNPALTAAQVVQILHDSADKVGPDAYSGGRNDPFGYGRVNAYQALLLSVPDAPTITSFTPTSGPVGTFVSVTGTNFTGATVVAFDGTSASHTVESSTSITATVPPGATTGPISVTTAGGTGTSASSFNVTASLPPTITSFTPTSGYVGTSVSISGTNFSGASVVAFNGTSASSSVDSTTSITAAVPAGATTGPISVTTPGGTATSGGSFTVIPAPTITGFAPTSGPAGTSVSITGTDFTDASAVAFNGTSASYTVDSATSITATVPAGATTGPISATTPGGTATSAASFTVIPQTFTDIGAGLTGVDDSSVAWGDYDNDGDLDILLAGYAGGYSYISKIYRNEGGELTDVGAGLTGVDSGSVAWGDYDNDGDLDILLIGHTASNRFTAVYRNDAGVFTNSGAGLPVLGSGSVAWGDYDNDGDLDILLTGSPVVGLVGSVYRNDDGVFTDIGAGLTGVVDSSVAWGDYDNDGDLDILLTGSTATAYVSQVFRNDAGVFTNIGAGLPGVSQSSVAWGDYDDDGDLDILLTGYLGDSAVVSRVYRNDGGVFADIEAGLPGVYYSSVAWGDYDNDGDLDILLTGGSTSGWVTQVYRNDGGVFADIEAGLTGVGHGSVAWGDYDNDGDLDILLTGYLGSSTRVSRVYRNDGTVPNHPPSAPSDLTATADGDSVTLGWSASNDAQTPAAGLTYNLRVGTTPGGGEVTPPMAAAGGYRRIPALGNAQHGTAAVLKTASLPAGTYYWSVQAVDTAFAGSTFSGGATFTVAPPTVTSFTPTSGPVGASVHITGTRLAGATAVAFNGTSASYTVSSATSISATVPSGATSGAISVTAPGGTATSASSFTVIPAPTITSFTPTSGGVGSSVAITGADFTGATAVAFNGTSASYTVNSATSISATVPSGATTGLISVTTRGGTATSASIFTVIPAPTISSFTPTSGPVATSVNITGTNFTGTTVVAFNGTSASYTVNSAASITATVPAGATTGPVSVTTPGGRATSASSFTVIPPPTITGLTPTSGPVGTSVTITGSSFAGTTGVAFNGTSASYTVDSVTAITATVPTGATTGPVGVTTAGGIATSASSFTVLVLCTSFTISPPSVRVPDGADSQEVTITGVPAGCGGGDWTASGSGSWITVSPTSGTGPGSATVSWDANPGVPRSGEATIAGETFAVTQGSPSTDYFTVTPCRVLDTRLTNALSFDTAETFQIGGECGVSASATAVAFNMTVVAATANGNCRLYPDPGEVPLVSTINFATGLTRANNAVVSLLTPPGTVTVRCVGASPGTVHVILDVFGYFDATGGGSE